jgi:hypothetical protein
MARKSDKKSPPPDDWKSKFIYLTFSHKDEVEISEYVKLRGVSSLTDLVSDILDNGGSVKLTHSPNDGSIFATVAADKKHQDYGGYQFGFRYANLPGLIAILDYVWYVVLASDVGLQYLPSTSEDWLNLS